MCHLSVFEIVLVRIATTWLTRRCERELVFFIFELNLESVTRSLYSVTTIKSLTTVCSLTWGKININAISEKPQQKQKKVWNDVEIGSELTKQDTYYSIYDIISGTSENHMKMDNVSNWSHHALCFGKGHRIVKIHNPWQ